jgi:hypothetical protein
MALRAAQQPVEPHDVADAERAAVDAAGGALEVLADVAEVEAPSDDASPLASEAAIGDRLQHGGVLAGVERFRFDTRQRGAQRCTFRGSDRGGD